MRISIITINRNNCNGLRKTIESVISQSTSPFEFIVIDGASSDGSTNLLKEYSNAISYSVSEPDKGIYNAMNKGVVAAHGEYCLFLNSGDALCHTEVLAQVKASGVESDIICGNAILQENPPKRKAAPTEITLRFLYGGTLCHQAVFIKTTLLRKHPYNESLRIVADREFFLQCLIFESCSYQAVNIDICNYDITGFSAQNRFASEQEWQAVMQAHIPERILIDYGQEVSGVLYGFSSYEKLFLEIGRRRWRKPVYWLVRSFLSCISVFIPSAKFVNLFPKYNK